MDDFILFPWRETIHFRRNNWNQAQIKYPLPCFITLVRFIHYYLSTIPAAAFKGSQKIPAFWRISCMTR